MIELPGVRTVVSQWKTKVEALAEEETRIAGSQDGYYKGSWDAAFERAEPAIQKDTVEDCLDDIRASSSEDDLIEAVADWRKEADSLDKRIPDQKESFRASTRRHQLEECVVEFSEVLADELFRDCTRCGDKQMPVSDKRRNEGYRWECENCTY